jgi:hypothetical protein
MTDFLNPLDFALKTGSISLYGIITTQVHWEANQEGYKPAWGFGYHATGTGASFTRGDGSSIALTDPREIMAFCARPHAEAAGARSGVL